MRHVYGRDRGWPSTQGPQVRGAARARTLRSDSFQSLVFYRLDLYSFSSVLLEEREDGKHRNQGMRIVQSSRNEGGEGVGEAEFFPLYYFPTRFPEESTDENVPAIFY